MKGKHLSDIERLEIASKAMEMRRDGITIKDIAHKLGVGTTTIARILYEFNPKPEPKPEPIVEALHKYRGGRLHMSGMEYTAEEEEDYQRWAEDSRDWFYNVGQYEKDNGNGYNN